ncbi:MAG TPA: lysylphosphatidylglycerol synthase transmembrane domain-containing protein [Flavobacteriaceae bacterium]|nr:lysylphosphatidylglycerol synthase transmembrane domain-containing protein [Flavobacteriaceae bacterium]
MKKRSVKILKTIIPLALGAFFVWYSIGAATPQERQKLWEHISGANHFWVGLSLVLGLASHLLRGYRWKFLLEPMHYRPSFTNRVMAVLIGYVANLGVPRSGEFLRAATLTTYEKIPFEKSLGTIISERIADLCMLLLVVGISLLIQADDLITWFKVNEVNPFLSIGILLILTILGLFFIKLLRKSQNKFLVKIREFAVGILEGMKSIVKMKRKKEFIFYTVLIWVLYVLMFYVVIFAIPSTSELPFGAVMVAFVVGSFAITLTNGGLGVYPVALGAILLLFGIDKQSGEAFGWIVWGSQTLLNLVAGGLSFILLPIYNRMK